MRRWVLMAFAMTALLGGRARADLVITIGNLNLAEKGTGYVDVMISGTGAGQDLALAGYEFQITPLVVSDPLNPATLEFVQIQDQSYMTSGNGVLPYVFPGSANQRFDPPFFMPVYNGTVSSVGGTNNDLTGGDGQLDINDNYENVTVTTDVILIRLQVTAAFDVLPKAGDTFSIDLVPATGGSGAFTGFQTQDQLFGPDFIPYTSTQGVVTIVPAAVPEPGSLALLGIGLALSGWQVRRRMVRSQAA